jgi:hypothetical protein
MSSPLRVEMLERQAEQQRDLLENRVVELRQNVKERLDLTRNIRRHVWPATGIATILGLALGYSLTGAFTRD